MFWVVVVLCSAWQPKIRSYTPTPCREKYFLRSNRPKMGKKAMFGKIKLQIRQK